MAKKKKSSKKSSKKPKSTRDVFANSMAEQLKELTANTIHTSDAQDVPPASDALAPDVNSPKHTLPHRPSLPTKEAIALSDDELFLHTVDAIDPSDIFRGKYMGDVHSIDEPLAPMQQATTSSPPTHQTVHNHTTQTPQTPTHTAPSTEELEGLREEIMFARAVGGVEPLEGNTKYRVPTPRASITQTPHEDNEEPKKHPHYPFSSEVPQGFTTPVLPKSGEGLNRILELASSQRGLLKQCKLYSRQHNMLVLNVRGDSIEDTLRRLELFVHQAWKDDARFVRIIHGRGLGSKDGVSVLKPTILHWLEGPGTRYVRGYAPELLSDGDYGSLIVALKKHAPKP